MTFFIQDDEELPTIIGFEPEAKEFVIGNKAKALRDNGKTGIYHFKQRVGELPSQFEKGSSLWYVNQEGKIQTVKIDEALKLYFSFLDPQDDLPRGYFVGIPSLSTNSQWATRYKAKIAEVLKSLGANREVRFVDEPIAVFEYYRQQEKLDDEKRLVTVIDVGGSTFNCSVIEQNGAQQDPRVISLRSDFFGGAAIDEQLFIEALADEPSLESITDTKKFFGRTDTPISTLKGRLEDLKIQLSREMARGEKTSVLHIDAGTLAPNAGAATLNVSTKHLRQSIGHAWEHSWHRTVNHALEDAKKKLKRDSIVIGALLLAGGSSRLPDMRTQAERSLHAYKGKKLRTPVVKDMERAVAHGIAAYCSKIAKANTGENVNALKQYFTGELHIAFKAHHKDDWELAEFDGRGTTSKIFSGGIDAAEKKISCDVVLPFRPSNSFHVGIFNLDPTKHPDSIVNLGDEIQRIQHSQIITKARIDVEFLEDGQIKIGVALRAKKSSDIINPIDIGPYRINEISMVQGVKYVGLDFGHSNTYVTTVVQEASDDGLIPNFRVDARTLNQLKRFNKKIEAFIKPNSKHRAAEYAERVVDEICYQSTKLEKEAAAAPENQSSSQTDEVTESPNPKVNQPLYLKKAYEQILESNDGKRHYESIDDSPLAYVKAMHGVFGANWIRDAGDFRKAGAESDVDKHEYLLPAFIEPELRDLSDSYRDSREYLKDPILAACKFHAAFEMIHPFSDGNGRIGRLILDAMCLRAGLPPVIISADRRIEYLDSLKAANTGDISSFVSLVIDHLTIQIEEIEKENAHLKAPSGEERASKAEEHLAEMRSGKTPLFDALRRRQKAANDIVALQFTEHADNLANFDTLLSDLASKFKSIEGSEKFSVECQITEVDQLSEESFNRFINGRKDLRFTYKKLYYSGFSAASNRVESKEVHFVCEGEVGNMNGLCLRLKSKQGMDSELVSLRNTMIEVTKIGISGLQPKAYIGSGAECSLEEAIDLIGIGMDYDLSLEPGSN